MSLEISGASECAVCYLQNILVIESMAGCLDPEALVLVGHFVPLYWSWPIVRMTNLCVNLSLADAVASMDYLFVFPVRFYACLCAC